MRTASLTISLIFFAANNYGMSRDFLNAQTTTVSRDISLSLVAGISLFSLGAFKALEAHFNWGQFAVIPGTVADRDVCAGYQFDHSVGLAVLGVTTFVNGLNKKSFSFTTILR